MCYAFHLQSSADDSSLQRDPQSLECSETEGMDTQHSETTSELERTEESASSLSLSSDQLHDNIVALAVDSITQSASSERLEPIRLRSGSHPERRPPRTDSGQWSTASEPGESAALSRLRSSSHGQDSSVDPDSSALSLDSSNGSTSQGDISQSEYEESIRFSAPPPESEVTRTSVRSDSASGGQDASQPSRSPQQGETEEGEYFN